MSNLVLDYSWARPGGAAIRAAGYVGVVRYISHDTTGKTISVDEANDLRGNGLGLALVFEDEANRALSGHDAGVADAQFAQSIANSIEFPEDRPIYFAVDTQAGDSNLAAIDAYLTGCKSVLGDRVGVYGDYTVVTHCSSEVKWLWQTLAWSHGAVDANAQLYQNGSSAFGGGADVDVVQQGDWGAWAAGSPVAGTTPTPEPAQPVVPNPVQSAGPGGTYTVVSGDGLITIGAKTGTDWRAIASINHISAPYTIYVGEKLALPGGSVTAAPVATSGRYTVVKNDTLSEIGSKLGVQWQRIASANGINPPYTIYPGQVLVVPGAGTPAPAANTYRVVSGDTLSGIGTKVGISWQSIAAKNGIGSPYTIYPNEVLQLP